MLEERTKLIHERAQLFGMSAGDFDALFADDVAEGRERDERPLRLDVGA
ncbi:MAG: hypothetical protein IPN32_18730 [Deltaproteobacteria bacterium]|nr:hypothetical protein [Deltaproteobacteria bacterium]